MNKYISAAGGLVVRNGKTFFYHITFKTLFYFISKYYEKMQKIVKATTVLRLHALWIPQILTAI